MARRSEISCITRSGSSYIVTREDGSDCTISFNTSDPADLRAIAADLQDRAARLVKQAEMACAIADMEEKQRAERNQAAAKQRKERTAATKARKADPFGFKAMGIKT